MNKRRLSIDIKETTKQTIVELFVLITLFSALLNEIGILPRYIVTYTNYISLLFGILSVIALYPDNYRLDTKIQNISYIAILGLALLSWIFNFEIQGSYGIKKIIYMIYNYYLIYISYRYLVRKTEGRFTKKVISLYIVFIFLATLLSIIMWFSNVSGLFFIEDRIRSVGIRFVMSSSSLAYLLLYGVFRDPNYASTLVTLSLILSLYIIVHKRNSLDTCKKIFLFLNISISLIYIILSNSRSNLIALSFVAFIWGLYYINRLPKEKPFKAICNWGLIIVIPILIYGGINTSRNILTRAINPYKTKFISLEYRKEFEDNSDYQNMRDIIKLDNWIKSREVFRPENATDDEKKIEFTHDSRKTDVGGKGNGRIDIWTEALALWKEQPLLGYGSTNFENLLEFSADADSMIARGYVLDNGYLDILLSYGIFSLIVYMIFVINSLLIPINIENKKIMLDQVSMLVISILIYMGITAFFYSDYLIGNIAAVLIIVLSLYHCINRHHIEYYDFQ